MRERRRSGPGGGRWAPALLLALLAACSPGRGQQTLYVHTQPPAGTTTRILVDPASLHATGREVSVGYTVAADTPNGREAYPDQPKRIEGVIAFECPTRRFRKLREVAYGFDGRAQPPDEPSMRPGEIAPGSDSEVLLDYACASPVRRWWTRYPVVRTG